MEAIYRINEFFLIVLQILRLCALFASDSEF